MEDILRQILNELKKINNKLDSLDGIKSNTDYLSYIDTSVTDIAAKVIKED